MGPGFRNHAPDCKTRFHGVFDVAEFRVILFQLAKQECSRIEAGKQQERRRSEQECSRNAVAMQHQRSSKAEEIRMAESTGITTCPSLEIDQSSYPCPC